MNSSTPAARRRLDVAIGLVVVGLLVATLVILADPGMQLAVVAPGLDIVINTVTTLTAAAVAALAFSRFREQGQSGSAIQAAAFAVLTAAGAFFLAAVLTGLDKDLGMTLARPSEVPLYVWTMARIMAGLLLMLGAWYALGARPLGPRRGAALVAGAVLVFTILIVGIIAAVDLLPALVTNEGLDRLAQDRRFPSVLVGITPLGAALQLLGAGLLVVAAAAYRRLYRRDAAISAGVLSLGLVVAAFSQVHFALHPGAYASLVTIGDLLRLAFYAILLVGVEVETRADLRALRLAHVELARMREAEVAGATREERARLAREIHDGLAQDLWYAKLKLGRLRATVPMGPDSDRLFDEVVDAIDTGIADTRQAVMAMRAGTTQGTFETVMREYVEDFGDRFGLLARIQSEVPVPWLPPRTQAELLRVVQEALNNVRKHADATVVTVRCESADDALRITVADNGRGFDAAAADGSGYGLRGMRERCEIIGARLAIDSRASDGTTVIVDVPLTGSLGP